MGIYKTPYGTLTMTSSPKNDSVLSMRYSANKPPIRTRRQSTGACDRRCSVAKVMAAAAATSVGCSELMSESVAENNGNRLVTPLETIDRRTVDEQLRSGYIVQAATAVTSSDWWTSFENLLHDPFGIELFTSFMRGEHSEENILFWKRCEAFRADTRDRKRLAQSIFYDFVNDSAPSQVNIDDVTRRRIKRHLADAPRDLFDGAQLLVCDLMKRDTYRRFVASRLYKEAVREAELHSVEHGCRSRGRDSFVTKDAKFQQLREPQGRRSCAQYTANKDSAIADKRSNSLSKPRNSDKGNVENIKPVFSCFPVKSKPPHRTDRVAEKAVVSKPPLPVTMSCYVASQKYVTPHRPPPRSKNIVAVSAPRSTTVERNSSRSTMSSSSDLYHVTRKSAIVAISARTSRQPPSPQQSGVSSDDERSRNGGHRKDRDRDRVDGARRRGDLLVGPYTSRKRDASAIEDSVETGSIVYSHKRRRPSSGIVLCSAVL